jgi:hypothetical protein
MQQIETVECVLGVLQQIDAIAREIAVLSDIGVTVFNVPPDCPIFLRGEQIKLRMLQPDDRIRVTFAKCREFLLAKSLDVQPDSDSSSPKV